MINEDIKTYGDVIRHMSNDELALFLEQGQFDIELGILSVMRAKQLHHRKPNEEPRTNKKEFNSFYNFMQHRIIYESADYGDVFGIDNWYDLMQYETSNKKNFGMDVVY